MLGREKNHCWSIIKCTSNKSEAYVESQWLMGIPRTVKMKELREIRHT